MSQANCQFDSDGVRFSKRLTIGEVNQFITQFVHHRSPRDAYLAHEAVLQYLQLESQSGGVDKAGGEKKKPAIQEIGDKMSIAVKNMSKEISHYDIVSLLSTLCGYFEITPFLEDPEFELIVKSFSEAFKKVWSSPASPTVPTPPEKVKIVIPYYFAACYAESGMPSAPMGHVYIPETRVFPGLVLGIPEIRDLLNCAKLAPDTPMSLEKLRFISEVFQYATADFYQGTEMLTIVASALGYALFTGNIDIFVQDEPDDEDDDSDMLCRALSFLTENLEDGASVSTEVILSFWAGAGAAVRQANAKNGPNKCLPIKHEAMMRTLEVLVTFFDVFNLTNIRADDLRKEIVDNKNTSLEHMNDLCASFFETVATCYRFADTSKVSSELGLHTFTKVSTCYLVFCIQRITILLSTGSEDTLKKKISDTIEQTLLLHDFVPSHKELLSKFTSIDGIDDVLFESITTSLAHRFSFSCNSMKIDSSCLFYIGDSTATLPLLWDLYLASAEILEPGALSEVLITYLNRIKAKESFSIGASKSLLSLALSAYIDDKADCDLFKDVYGKLKDGSKEEKEVYLSYLSRKLQVSHDLSVDYTTRIRDELKSFEDVFALHCKLCYTLLSVFSSVEVADDQVDLLSPDKCDIVGALVSFRKNYNDSASISRHLERFLQSVSTKDMEKRLLPLFQKENLDELTIPEVKPPEKTEDKDDKDGKGDDDDEKAGNEKDSSSNVESDSSSDAESNANNAAIKKFQRLSLSDTGYYLRRNDITHLSALLEILYVSIHHTDGVKDHLVMNVLIPLLLHIMQMMFAHYSSLAGAMDVSHKWDELSRFSKKHDETYTSGERRLAVIVGWVVCIVDRLGEIYDYSTILWSMLKLNADTLKTMVYDVYIHDPRDSFVPVPLAIVVAYLLTIITSINFEQALDDLLYLTARNLRLSGNTDLDKFTTRDDVLNPSNATSVCTKIAPFLATQMSPLKEKAQECAITSYAVIAMEITSDIADLARKKSQPILKKAANVFKIISDLIPMKGLVARKSSELPDPFERNYTPAGAVSDRFYIALLELVTDAYREGCEIMDAVYSTTITTKEHTAEDLKATSGYRIAYIMGVIAIIIHDTGAFPNSPYYSEKQIGNLLRYALELKNYFTNSEESHILANAIQIICNYLVRFETYEHSELKNFVERMKEIRDYAIPEDASLETMRMCYNLKEVSCASLVALADNKAFSAKHGMKPLENGMKKTLSVMTSLPWKNMTAAEIAKHLLESMTENNVITARKNRAMFNLATSVIECLDEALEASYMESDDSDDDDADY